MQRFAQITPSIRANLGERIASNTQYLEQLLGITEQGVWIMTRQTIGTQRKEWFAIKPLGNDQYELITGKAKVEPFIQPSMTMFNQVQWVTTRECYTHANLDRIEWRRLTQSGTYQVALLKSPELIEQYIPAPGKHWVVLNALEPTIFNLLADSETHQLLASVKR